MSNCISENIIFVTRPTYATTGNVCYKNGFLTVAQADVHIFRLFLLMIPMDG